MSTEAEEIQRIVSASVRDMLDAFRIQASAGPVTDKALEEIIFRGAHGVLTPEPREVPGSASVVRILLTIFIEEMAKKEDREWWPPCS